MNTNPSSRSVPTARADTQADKHGRSVPLHPAGRRRLVELQAELEKSIGPHRVRVQEEIDRLQNAAND
jgi:hypothetical protein